MYYVRQGIINTAKAAVLACGSLNKEVATKYYEITKLGNMLSECLGNS